MIFVQILFCYTINHNHTYIYSNSCNIALVARERNSVDVLVLVVRLGVYDFKLGRKLNIIENSQAEFVHVKLQMKIILQIQDKRKLCLTAHK